MRFISSSAVSLQMLGHTVGDGSVVSFLEMTVVCKRI